MQTSHVTTLIEQGLQLFLQGKRRQALELAQQASVSVEKDPVQQSSLATLLTHLEEPLQALPHHELALRLEPDNVRFRYNLASAQRMCGQLEAAETNLDRVLLARPQHGEAHYLRSGLRTQTSTYNHVDQLRRVLQTLRGKRAAVPVGFALAKELEDLGEYRESFAVLSEACRLHRGSIRYDVSADVAVLERLVLKHTQARLRTVQSELDNSEASFIIGLPRSGTTLVERILGMHSDVHPAGELEAFQSVAIQAVSRGRAGPGKLEFVDRLLEVDFSDLGQAYLEEARPRAGHTPQFTDKFPANYLYAGAIHAALPRARFIALRRTPMDSCFALYKTLFAAAYPFSYDLLDLGRYYVAWDRLMRHWEEVIGEQWLTVEYEALVSRPEPVSRQMLEHCGLEWQAQCLQFQSAGAAVSTASAVQVRQRLYTTSVGKWRHHARELQPLLHHLQANAISLPDPKAAHI